jgi:dinuclear metal center YbgI/SA1388 family protein
MACPNRQVPVKMHAMLTSDLLRALDHIAPRSLAAEWDNVGLLLGSGAQPCSRALVAIDLTDAVLDEAIRLKSQAIVLYHPPIFAPLRQLNDATPRGALLLRAARAGIALLSPHTALDAADGGVNDFLCSVVGEGQSEPLEPAAATTPGQSHRVTVHVPIDHVDAVRAAMARAGAGTIGEYTHCSFEVVGSGTFMPGEAARPRVGSRGTLERVTECRLEKVCSAGNLPAVIAAIRASHPYEEPAFTIEALAPVPMPRAGQGRLMRLRAPMTARSIMRALASGLRLRQLELVGDPSQRHAVLGLCAGSGGELIAGARTQGATLFITGELKHHDRLDAAAHGTSVILCGHTETERPYLRVLARRLQRLLPGLKVTVSRADRPPARLLEA